MGENSVLHCKSGGKTMAMKVTGPTGQPPAATTALLNIYWNVDYK